MIDGDVMKGLRPRREKAIGSSDSSERVTPTDILSPRFIGPIENLDREGEGFLSFGVTSSSSGLMFTMCFMSTLLRDVAQVADAARNLEILRDRDDYDRSERSDKRHKSGDRYQSATQQNSYRGHDQKNDRQGSDRQGDGGLYFRYTTQLYPLP
ncbi:hypothetical protein Tco_0497243 [Tanacetum coccineum]